MALAHFLSARGRAGHVLRLMSIALLGCGASPATSADLRTGFIVWNLPEKSDDAYRQLRDLAGVSEGKALANTGAEIWAVAADRAAELRRACGAQAVSFSEFNDQASELVWATAARVESDETPPPLQAHLPMIQRAMRSDAVTSVTMLQMQPPAVVEYALMRPPMPGVATEPQGDIVIRLGPGAYVRARRTHVDTHGSKVFWHGRTADEGLPVSLIWAPDGLFAGSLMHNGKSYVIKTIEGGMHAAIEMEDGKLPSDHPSPAAPRSRRPPPVDSTPAGGTIRIDRSGEDRRNLEDAPADAGTSPAPGPGFISGPAGPELISGPALNLSREAEITVLFAYTPAAASHYSDIRSELVELALDQTNQSFRSSGIGNVRIANAGMVQVDYEEGSGGLFDHLWNLVDRGDGLMDDIHQVRDRMRADIVVLILDSPDACGLATRVNAEADEAFAVVHHACAMTSYSIPHEIGHLLGGRHDRAVDDSGRPFPFGHGFVNGNKWRTIMAYKSSCNGCPRLPIWSNPNVLIEGEPAGDSVTFDARVVAEQAARVAAFR